jgi:hypothetical protein
MAGIMEKYRGSLERIRTVAAKAALTSAECQNRASIWKSFAMIVALIVALLLLAGCGRFDEARERAACQQAHPDSQVSVNKCLKIAADRWVEANAWLPRLTQTRTIQ